MEKKEKSELTPAQKEILDFIKERCDQNAGPPSYREIQDHFGYKAIGTVQDHIQALIKKGWLESPAKRRARGVLPLGHKIEGVKRIPIYGEIAAGSARETQQLEFGELVVSKALAKNPTFALKVTGDSMVEVGMYEGDLLIVEQGARIKNGDIVVALLDGDTTVKRYMERGGEILLVPENRRMKPIAITTQNLEIQGKVVGLQRKL